MECLIEWNSKILLSGFKVVIKQLQELLNATFKKLLNRRNETSILTQVVG